MFNSGSRKERKTQGNAIIEGMQTRSGGQLRKITDMSMGSDSFSGFLGVSPERMGILTIRVRMPVAAMTVTPVGSSDRSQEMKMAGTAAIIN